MSGETKLKAGDVVGVKVKNVDKYDLWGSRV
ncbi:hypothetical protein [Kluyvera sichuanensis]